MFGFNEIINAEYIFLLRQNNRQNSIFLLKQNIFRRRVQLSLPLCRQTMPQTIAQRLDFAPPLETLDPPHRQNPPLRTTFRPLTRHP